MLTLHENGDPIDVLTLTEHLRERGRLEAAGGEAELHGLSGSVPAVGHVRRYAQIVQDNALSRALLGVAYDTQASVAQRTATPARAGRAGRDGRSSTWPTTAGARSSARWATCLDTSSTSCTSSRSRAPR